MIGHDLAIELDPRDIEDGFVGQPQPLDDGDAQFAGHVAGTALVEAAIRRGGRMTGQARTEGLAAIDCVGDRQLDVRQHAD